MKKLVALGLEISIKKERKTLLIKDGKPVALMVATKEIKIQKIILGKKVYNGFIGLEMNRVVAEQRLSLFLWLSNILTT